MNWSEYWIYNQTYKYKWETEGFLNKNYHFLLIDLKRIKFKLFKRNKPHGLFCSLSDLVIESLIN